VLIQQRLSLPTVCELAFYDPRGPIGEADVVLSGSSFRIGVEGHEGSLFTGQVTAVHYGYGSSQEREVRVRGYDLLHRLRKRQPVRAHVQLTLVELARTLVADLGVSVEASEPGPVWQRLVQYRQSDFELMAEVAERCGLYFMLEDEVLRFFPLEGRGPVVPLQSGSSLLEVGIDVNADPACRSVAAMGWDPWRVEQHVGQADIPRVGRQTAAEAPPETVGGTGERTIVGETVQDDLQVEGIAQAELDRCIAREVSLHGVADGDPRLRPGAIIQVRGVADPLCGQYVLTKVTHKIDRNQGFISEIDTAPPEPRARMRGTLTTYGRVTQVEDPESLGRIRVSLPNYGDVETDWLEVVMPGAGADKGIIALPEVGDKVLLLFAREDPAQGVVVGGLYGSQGPPDAGVEDGAVRRYTFLTSGGQRVRLDDAGKKVRIENSGGNYLQASPGKVKIGNSDGSFVELSGDTVRIHSETTLEIEAPGQSIVIRGQSIDFERA